MHICAKFIILKLKYKFLLWKNEKFLNLSITLCESSFSLIDSAALLTPSKHRPIIGATAVSALAAPFINSFSALVLFSSISCNLLKT